MRWDLLTTPVRAGRWGWASPALALTVLDALLTLVWLQAGLAVEANPWLADLVASVGPAPAMLVRAGAGVLLVLVLWIVAHVDATARHGLTIVTWALGGVLVWHVLGGLATVVA